MQRPHARKMRPARASRNVTRLATDLLREVLSYSDLRMLAASAATCRALLDAVPPKLAHELVHERVHETSRFAVVAMKL